ncbi:Origin recognition complex subunit 2 [Candida viswanathii]|uniref:Origin recognition complex subunit 2 n=1 Tax=Candida viswanathii TaxID=5486 RepID=A0A367XPC1_9ASCO|nr:Origin recognition complex subunit 2 [Candida viswanathii]
MSRPETPRKSPFRSPSKRRLESLASPGIPKFKFSPVKTPNGRAGLASPEKRSAHDIDQSARKRANNSLYNRLMDEYDGGNDYLDEQDRILAERIIRESRGEVYDNGVNYGMDVELEIDLTKVVPKPVKPETITKRTAPKRNARNKSCLKLPEYASDSSSEEFVDDEGDVSDDAEELDGFVEDVSEEEFEVKTASLKVVKRKSETSLKAKSYPGLKKKRGRPSRSELVADNVKSIFHKDDELLRPQKKQDSVPPKAKETVLPKPPAKYLHSIFDQIYDRNSVPTISGIPKSRIKEDESMVFEPLPIPRLDADGNIADEEYLQKYFDGVDPGKYKEGRFLDDKVFFLEGAEGYFEQQSRRYKMPATSLSSVAPELDFSEFYNLVKLGDNISSHHKQELWELHKYLYHQWCFEMTQGFNLNFYGIGSKIDILKDFAQNYFGNWWSEVVGEELPKVLVINGYNPGLNTRKLINDIGSILVPDVNIPKHSSGTVQFVVNYLEESREPVPERGFHAPKLLLIVHNLDGEAFRVEKIQTLLGQLMALPEVWAMSSTDHINAPLLWDLSKLKNMNFIWHDLTTFSSYQRESSFKDVLNIGRSKKYVGGLGAKFVLRSLTENHRNLYRELLIAQLENIERAAPSEGARIGLKGNIKVAVELKELFNKCLNEFITSNEITFRTFLKEYVEHKMCQLVKSSAGVEMIFVPFTYEEIQSIYKQEFE